MRTEQGARIGVGFLEEGSLGAPSNVGHHGRGQRAPPWVTCLCSCTDGTRSHKREALSTTSHPQHAWQHV